MGKTIVKLKTSTCNAILSLRLCDLVAHTHSLIYNRELTITLVYKYKANSIEFKNNRVLLKVY